MQVLKQLSRAGYQRLAVLDNQLLFSVADANLEDYEIVNKIISENVIQIICTDEQVPDILEVLTKAGRTESAISGWVYVSDIESSYLIEGSAHA